MRLKDLLSDQLSTAELVHLVQGYDLVGDLAITIIPPQLTHRERLIGEAILAANKRIKVVAKRDGVYQGKHRTIPLSIIAGEHRKETLHSEFGVRLLVNPELVYFSVRSGTERKRVSDLVRPDESVLVMFSGIAPYPLMINKYSEAASIVGIEANPVAHKYALQNQKLNKADETRVKLLRGNVADIVPQLNDIFHRIVMPLPTGAIDFLPLALKSLLPGGTIHFYDFQPRDEHAPSHAIRKKCAEAGRKALRTEYFVCGHTRPGIKRICIDTLVQ